jgi:hypothetical protein
MKSIAALSSLLAFVSTAPAIDLQTRSDSQIRPLVLSLYTPATGATAYNVPTGKIYKNNGGLQDPDITTLITFSIPASAAGKTCSFVFDLNNCLHCNPSVPTGTATFDVYTSLAPATQDTTTWPNGNLRDEYAGRLTAVKPGSAVWLDGFPNEGQAFPCPAGQLLAGELVGAGDVLNVQWDGQGEGPYIRVTDY